MKKVIKSVVLSAILATNWVSTPWIADAQQINPIYPQYSSTAVTTFQFKGSNFYGLSVTPQSAAGYILLFDATVAPSDGTVTPVKCIYAGYPGTTAISLDPSAPWTAKYTWIVDFSSTGCFTQTTSPTMHISGQVQ